jgi:alpha-tubulin suppressor-like RCC1 family protein
MDRWTGKGRVRRVITALGLAGGVLSGVSCRGNDITEPTEPSTGSGLRSALATTTSALPFGQVSAGGLHTCGVTSEAQAYCWGYNNYGQLGDGTTTGPELCLALGCSTRPVAVLGGLRFRQVSAGEDHTCGVTTDYRAYCWGLNSGALGDGTMLYRTKPVAVAGGLHFRQVSAAHSHTCGVTTDNRAYCWGYNGAGQLGNGMRSIDPQLTPVAVVGGLQFRQVSGGTQHTCGVTTDNRVFCWGQNSSGQIGDSTEVSLRLSPTRVAAGTRQWRQIDAGFSHTCAVTTTYRAFCWGNGREGQLGNGKSYLSFWPRAVAGGLSFERVTAGHRHTCGETTTNRAYCWGYNDSGQLGDGTTIQRLTPVAVVGALSFRQVSAGGYHSCGVTSGSLAWCWGVNRVGELGDGTTTSRSSPTRVAGVM